MAEKVRIRFDPVVTIYNADLLPGPIHNWFATNGVVGRSMTDAPASMISGPQTETLTRKRILAGLQRAGIEVEVIG